MLGGAILAFLFWLQDVHRLRHRITLGEAIRAYRKKAGLSQEGLAERADLSLNFVAEVERGKMECSVTSLLKIAKGLRVHGWQLIRKL
jgi:transcriptional regulator with XRE-family HTH domain